MDHDDVIIKTLAMRINELEKSLIVAESRNESFLKKFRRDYYRKLMLAFSSNAKDLKEVKPGDVIRDSNTIYLVRTCKVTFDDGDYRIFGFASAAVFEFPDEREQISIEIETIKGTIDIEDNMKHLFPASDHDIMLFDYLLKEKGYKRTSNGKLERISE